MDPRAQLDVEVEHRVGLPGQEPRMAHGAAFVELVLVTDLAEIHRCPLSSECELERAEHGAGREERGGHGRHR